MVSHNYTENPKDEASEASKGNVPNGGQWECSSSTCGWGNNSYTEDAMTNLESAFNKLMSGDVKMIHQLVLEMDTCMINNHSTKKGHHRTCYMKLSAKTHLTIFTVQRNLLFKCIQFNVCFSSRKEPGGLSGN